MSLINEALKQTRGQTSPASHDGPMGMPVTHSRDSERRTFRTDLLIIAAVLVLPLLLFGGAALFYLTKTRGSQPPTVSAPTAPPVPVATPAPVPPVASSEPPRSVTNAPPLATAGSAEPASQEPQTPAPEPAPAPGPPPSRAAVDKLVASLTVTAILDSGSTAKAVVNSRIVKVGDTIEGAVIVAIGADAVTLELDGEKAELVLK